MPRPDLDLPSEPDDRVDLRVRGDDRPEGFIRPDEAQRGARYRMAVAIPAITVSLATVVGTGAIAVMLGASGDLVRYEELWVPALISGGVFATLAGVAASLDLWPERTPAGPARILAFGLGAALCALVFAASVAGFAALSV